MSFPEERRINLLSLVTILVSHGMRITENISFHKTNRVTQRIPREAFAYRSPVFAVEIFNGNGVTGKQLMDYLISPYLCTF